MAVAAPELEIGAGESLLVVAPHPDDETLGAGGLIQRILEKGGFVRVVLITSGDGYIEAVARDTGRLRPRPLTLLLVFALLYVGVGSVAKPLLVMASVPLSLVGGIVLMWWLGYYTSVAVWAGAVALIGVAVETTSIMVVFLDEAWRSRAAEGRLSTSADFVEATREGAERCLRPS